MKDVLVIWGSFFAAGFAFWFWELLAPARWVDYRREVPKSLAAFATVFCFFLLVGGIADVILPPQRIAAVGERIGVAELPSWVRAVAFYLVWDCSMYWVHRFMHTGVLWRTHRWHHAPTSVWWLVGVRGSLPHIFITYFPFLWFWLFHLPPWFAVVASISSVVGNIWMHVNLDGRWMQWLEYCFVTPRFHIIHHSVGSQHHQKNLGSLFTVWDHLFGTYLDPETVDRAALKFGISEPVGRLRLALGI